ncbi:butyrophilin subfamily 1 member A1-like isoform X2 [Amia ocellicauda]|uniref:butyrophilin subfamily 1 member A1-like isoform X2 n=1 Tax=Amia ocellicauda TaxID=2972642 RepID=UPI0034638C81
MKSDRSEWLCVIVLLLQQTSVSGSERFEVLGPHYPIAVYPGEDTVLPCYLSPNISAEDMEIRWFTEDPSAPVCLFWYSRYDFDKQIPSYKGRAELFPEEFRKGNVSLRLKDVRGSDDGLYKCLVESADSYEEALIDVVVRGQPSVSLHSEGGQTRLEFRSDPYPEPAVIWTDRDGHDVTSLSNTTVQRDSEGRLSLRSSIPVRQESNVFSCLIRSAVSEPNWEPQLHISRDFFPDPSGWMVSLFLMATLTVAAAALLLIQWRRMDKKERLFESQVLPVLRSQLDEEYQWTFNVRHGRWADVTLDPDTAHCALTLSEDGKRVRRGDRQHLPDNQQRFDFWSCVVSRESFTSGRHYWVLEVNGGWIIGVTRESANRRGGISFTPQQGYWCLDCDSSSLSALTDPETRLPQTLRPRMLGVCVDIEERRVSFYTVESRAHIYTFTDMCFPEGDKIYPFFRTWDRNRDLVILPPVETETGHS